MRAGRVCNKRPTIIDVARLAGVSKSTVARALSGATNINAETRRHVMAVVEATGYERNHLARGLRSGRSGVLGMVIPDIANPFWAELARGAQDVAAEGDASLMIFSSDWSGAREARHLQALRQARVEGAIVNPVADNVDALGWFGLPVVLIGSSAERFPEMSSVASDIAQGVRLGLDYLVAKGHEAPCFIVGPRSRLARARFLRVVHDHCLERDFDPGVLIIEEGEYTVASGIDAMKRILARKPPLPAAVFAANDLMALGATLAVADSGLRCPADVSVLGFDGIPAGAFSNPGLTTIEKPARAIGAEAMRTLLDILADRAGQAELTGQAKRQRTVLACRLEERGSVADLTEGVRRPALAQPALAIRRG